MEFEKNSHGMILLEEQQRINNTLSTAENSIQCEIIHELNHMNNKTHDNVRPYYPGSIEIKQVEHLAISHQYWLNFVIKRCSITESRDQKNYGSTSQIALIFTEKQDKDHNKMKYFKNEMIHFLFLTNLIDKQAINSIYLPNILKQEAADIMLLSKGVLHKTYVEHNSLNDKSPTKIFGMNVGKSFYKTCVGRFEFFVVLIESNTSLNRHINYSNDGSPFYKFRCSYSYLIIFNIYGKLYHVNFIMTTRLVRGQFITEVS